MQPVLKFNVRNQNISRVDTFLPVRYSRNYLYAEFDFKTCDWNEKTKTAIFSGTGLEPIPVILGETDTCLVPWEVLECAEFSVTVHAGDLVTVDSAKVKLYESGYRPGDVPEPTPDVYQQLINMLTDQVDGLTYTDNILSLMAGEKNIASVTITVGSGSGTDGREVELQNDGTHIQWRYAGEEVWNNLVSLSDLTGKSAYEYAKEGGYTGTEEEFSQKLKKEIPDVDSILNEESKNAIQNKAVAKAISLLSDEIDNKEEAGTAESRITAHNTSTDAHNDIRLLIQNLVNTVTTLLDSDDETLDQTSEIVAYIKSNKSLIDAITTSKVSVSDIIDNLTTNVVNKPLSASQGVKLKALIDAIIVPTKLSELKNDSGYAKATDIPDKLPNPQKLTFTGAVTAEYDGSGAVTVTIPEGSGGSGGTARIEKLSTDTTVELEPNKLYIFPEMAELTLALAEPTDTGIVNEYHVVFQSGATATTLTLPDTVKLPSGFSIDANKVYEISILEGCLCRQSWEVDASA